jgi:hypothetical protein
MTHVASADTGGVAKRTRFRPFSGGSKDALLVTMKTIFHVGMLLAGLLALGACATEGAYSDGSNTAASVDTTDRASAAADAQRAARDDAWQRHEDLVQSARDDAAQQRMDDAAARREQAAEDRQTLRESRGQ